MRISEWSSDVCSSDLHNANRKKASRMRNCPNCRREVSEEARYCRACYTVLPEIDPAVVARDRKRAKLISLFSKLSIIAAVGGAVLPINSHPQLFPTPVAAAQRQRAAVPASKAARR